MDEVEEEFYRIREVVSMVFPQLADVQIRESREDNEEHEQNKRHYATAHLDTRIVTYASAMNDLPIEKIRGIIWHEFGHFVDDLLSSQGYEPPKKDVEKFLKDLEYVPHEDKWDEAKANYYVWRFFKKRIKYDVDTIQRVS